MCFYESTWHEKLKLLLSNLNECSFNLDVLKMSQVHGTFSNKEPLYFISRIFWVHLQEAAVKEGRRNSFHSLSCICHWSYNKNFHVGKQREACQFRRTSTLGTKDQNFATLALQRLLWRVICFLNCVMLRKSQIGIFCFSKKWGIIICHNYTLQFTEKKFQFHCLLVTFLTGCLRARSTDVK